MSGPGSARAYHFWDGELTFPDGKTELRTYQQGTISDSGVDAQPITVLRQTGQVDSLGFIPFELQHETERHRRGRAYGKPEYFDSYTETGTYDCWYHTEKKCFICSAPKAVTNAALKRLIKLFPNHINLVQGEIDFNPILQMATDVRGEWIKLDGARVSTIGMFGHQVHEDEGTNSLRQAGERKALTVVLKLDNAEYNIQLVKKRCVVLFDNLGTAESLSLLLKLYPLIY